MISQNYSTQNEINEKNDKHLNTDDNGLLKTDKINTDSGIIIEIPKNKCKNNDEIMSLINNANFLLNNVNYVNTRYSRKHINSKDQILNHFSQNESTTDIIYLTFDCKTKENKIKSIDEIKQKLSKYLEIDIKDMVVYENKYNPNPTKTTKNSNYLSELNDNELLNSIQNTAGLKDKLTKIIELLNDDKTSNLIKINNTKIPITKSPHNDWERGWEDFFSYNLSGKIIPNDDESDYYTQAEILDQYNKYTSREKNLQTQMNRQAISSLHMHHNESQPPVEDKYNKNIETEMKINSKSVFPVYELKTSKSVFPVYELKTNSASDFSQFELEDNSELYKSVYSVDKLIDTNFKSESKILPFYQPKGELHDKMARSSLPDINQQNRERKTQIKKLNKDFENVPILLIFSYH